MGNELGGMLGGVAVLALFLVYIGVIIFLISLLWRITKALERMARHQLEIARDVKRLAEASEEKQK